ncbi:MAG: monofunctional biosynthetic peptidoglycan transglycosylase [Deltaproteobacteria bacterium]|nr:monofunctional biosynthetic peptidoglycan transglycosylase [Deltaproteobacteria bacterium]
MARSRKQRLTARALGWATRVFLRVLLALVVLSVVEVGLLRFLDPPITVPIAMEWLSSRVESKRYKRPVCFWRSLAEISPNLIKAVLAGEDQRFFLHRGFDFIELKEAFNDLLSAKRMRGASTITMQTARTIFLWQGRSWTRKITEAYYTVLIELLWDKRRILEVYLNTVDWGKGVMGAEAASRKYFQRSAKDLSRREAAMLASILPSPYRWSPVQPNDQVRRRAERIMKDMNKIPVIY